MPDKLAQMKETFAIEAARNSVYPIGGGLWIPILHPELRISTPYREWNFTGDITRMPEFCAPALGNRANLVTIDARRPAETPAACSTRWAAPAAGSPATSTTAYLCYEYNLFIVMRTKIRSEQTLPAGPGEDRGRRPSTPSPGPAGPLDITIDGQRRRSRHGPGADQRPAAVHRQRLPRHRHLPRRPRLPGLLRPRAVPVQRHDRHVNVRYTS